MILVNFTSWRNGRSTVGKCVRGILAFWRLSLAGLTPAAVALASQKPIYPDLPTQKKKHKKVDSKNN